MGAGAARVSSRSWLSGLLDPQVEDVFGEFVDTRYGVLHERQERRCRPRSPGSGGL